MKKILSLVSLIFLSVALWGQSDEAKSTNEPFQHQIGTDLSPLFRSLFKPNQDANIFFNAPYIFTYKSIQKNLAFRFGIGADIKQEISNDNSDDKLIQSSLRVRMGFEKQRKITERWQINTGVDLKFATSKFDDNLSSNFNNKSKNYGLAPLLGVQFQLTPHLYLQTEAAFNLYYQVNSFESNFDIIFPGPVIEPFKNFKTFGGYITIPNALLLVVEF